MSEVREYHIPVTRDGESAVDCLQQASGLSKQKLKQAMQKGCVWLERASGSRKTRSQVVSPYYAVVPDSDQSTTNTQFIQRLRRAKKALKAGDMLHFYYDTAVLSAVPTPATLISDCGDYSVWDKPCGMLSQGSKWGDHCTIYRWAEQHLVPERPAFIVHRLDRAASGLIILAHKKSTAAAFSQLFAQRQIEKHYRVWVDGDFRVMIPEGEMLKTIRDDIDGKPACSHVTLLQFDDAKNQSLLDVNIETGRKHQIRKHLLSVGYPVVGDRLYGSVDHDVDLQLQAVMLKFTCPVSGDVVEFGLSRDDV
ncbi:MAG: RNA pseudouridine synthase [Proteobacteria bacterium]|nr:MAG: RNA pseudouridine synthase [Pseudomonadota bacterium]